jgi:plastocyanin
MLTRRTIFAGAIASLVAGAALWAAISAGVPRAAHAQAPEGAPAAVEIRDFGFHPATMTIAEGTIVTWTNKDDEPHTVYANDRAYHSTPMDTDDHYSHAFTAPGEYHYFCSLHPHMTGVIIVRAQGS